MGTKLYVGNLNFTTTEDVLKAAFSGDGRGVRAVTIPSDRDTGRPRGFAFVDMATDEDAKSATKAFDGKELDGRVLKVSEAQERPARGGAGGGAGGGARRY